MKRREAKGKGERGRYTQLNAEFQRTARREKKKSPFKRTMQRNRGKQLYLGKIRDHFKNIRDTKGTFHATMGSIKDRNGMDLNRSRRY